MLKKKTGFSGVPAHAALIVFGLVLLLTAALARADSPHRVGLVVEHGDGEIIKQCLEFSEDKISGYEVLERSGLDLNVDLTNAMGAAVCRIDNEGCTYPEEECFCECSGGGGCVFWSYWILEGAEWEFSGMGASGAQVGDGDVQGWKWGSGTAEGASPPPVFQFDEICEPLVTDTPTPTNTPEPTDTPEPTHTPEPTDTPKPKEKPVIHHFTAGQTTIEAGERVTLNWDLSGAEAAYLRYNGAEEGVIAPGSKTVSPSASTVYTLVAKNEGGETTAQVTVTVKDTPPPPTATPLPAPTAAAAPAVSPSATPIPEPVINFTAASLTVPRGACTNLQWSAEQAESLLLDDNPVEMQGTREVCPAQSQTFRLRAVYPGGEKVTELSLTVTEAQLPPTATPSPTAIASRAEAQATLPPATPAAVVVSPAAEEAGTTGGPRRFTVSTETDESDSNSIWRAGAVVVVLGLFVIVPVGLVVTGWIVWWLKGKNR